MSFYELYLNCEQSHIYLLFICYRNNCEKKKKSKVDFLYLLDYVFLAESSIFERSITIFVTGKMFIGNLSLFKSKRWGPGSKS